VANKSLWLALDAAVALHRRIEFTWVKAHSGILHNEVADTLATRGVKGGTHCPIDWFNQLPADTEEDDDPSIPLTEVITQTEEFGADDVHLPEFGTPAVVYGFGVEEAADVEEERERGINTFLHRTCDNSSTPVSDNEDGGNTDGPAMIRYGWTAEEVGSEQSEQSEPPQEPGFSLVVGYAGPVDMPDSVAPSPWSSTWAQARAESEQRRANEERFKWMTDADLQMLTMGLEPYPWDQFADAVEQSREGKFHAIEQRACTEQVLQAAAE
jgi:hypothetical protein